MAHVRWNDGFFQTISYKDFRSMFIHWSVPKTETVYHGRETGLITLQTIADLAIGLDVEPPGVFWIAPDVLEAYKRILQQTKKPARVATWAPRPSVQWRVAELGREMFPDLPSEREKKNELAQKAGIYAATWFDPERPNAREDAIKRIQAEHPELSDREVSHRLLSQAFKKQKDPAFMYTSMPQPFDKIWMGEPHSVTPDVLGSLCRALGVSVEPLFVWSSDD